MRLIVDSQVQRLVVKVGERNVLRVGGRVGSVDSTGRGSSGSWETQCYGSGESSGGDE